MTVRLFRSKRGLSGWLAGGAMMALVVASVSGQEAGFLDTRPGSQPEPSITRGSADGGGIGCGGCVTADPLRVEIERLTLIDRGPFPGVEWTIRVTNQTKSPIQLPSSLSGLVLRSLGAWDDTKSSGSTLARPLTVMRAAKGPPRNNVQAHPCMLHRMVRET